MAKLLKDPHAVLQAMELNAAVHMLPYKEEHYVALHAHLDAQDERYETLRKAATEAVRTQDTEDFYKLIDVLMKLEKLDA